MFEALDRKLMNVWVLLDLIRLKKEKYPDPVGERKIQNKRIRKLMKRAYKIPFYRAKFDTANVTPKDFKCAEDMKKFPVLTKEEFRAWMEQECTKEQYKYYYLDSTSGSSGVPTKILYSPQEKAWNTANWLRVLMKAGYNPFLGKTMYRWDHNSVAADNGILQRFGILRHDFIEQYAPEQEIIDRINKYQPDLFYINKTELVRIAMYARRNNRNVYHPKMVIPIGEMIDEKSKQLFKEVFGPNVLDAFGTAEVGSCMTKYPGENVHRVHSDLFVVDVVNDSNCCGETGLLVVTPLFKTDIPLINYVVGDNAVATKENGVIVISELKGRSSDKIIHDDGQVTTFFMINDAISHCPGVLQMRLVQKTYKDLDVQIVWDENSSWEQKDIETKFEMELNKCMRKSMNINFCWMDRIPADKNGKLRLIISELDG